VCALKPAWKRAFAVRVVNLTPNGQHLTSTPNAKLSGTRAQAPSTGTGTEEKKRKIKHIPANLSVKGYSLDSPLRKQEFSCRRTFLTHFGYLGHFLNPYGAKNMQHLTQTHHQTMDRISPMCNTPHARTIDVHQTCAPRTCRTVLPCALRLCEWVPVTSTQTATSHHAHRERSRISPAFGDAGLHPPIGTINQLTEGCHGHLPRAPWSLS
jgi:hypothetical protein